MKYIIMCGGHYATTSIPKQLYTVNGERIVLRTIRLLKECGVEDIAISSHNPIFKRFGVPVLSHENKFRWNGEVVEEGAWVDAFYPTSSPACYILGDVYFSPEAIKKIVETKTKDIEFFASAPPYSKNYIKNYAEPFAFKVENQEHFQNAILMTKKLQSEFNRHPIAWELWQVIKGTPLNKIDYTNYTVINDYTTDIDIEKEALELDRLLRKLK